MIESTIRFVLSNYTLTFFVIGLMAAGIALARRPKPLSREQTFDRFLAYYCLIAIGVYFCWNFVMHVFFGKMAAKFIGWEDSPFQFEVGTASLGFGVVGLLAFRRDFGLRLAAITGPAMFMWGAAVGHVQQMIQTHNFAPGNAGVTFWMDILLPIMGYAFLIGWRRARRMSSPAYTSSVRVAQC
jgi:hypothetical protein